MVKFNYGKKVYFCDGLNIPSTCSYAASMKTP